MSQDIQIDYKAPPTLRRFLRSRARVRAIIGPVGSGKSSASCLEVLRKAVSAKPGLDGVRRTRGVIVRNTYPELRDTSRKTFEEWVPSSLGEWVESENKFVIDFEDDQGRVHSEVLFRALDRPDDVKKLLSLELTWAYLNEAKEIPKAVFDMMQARIGRYPARKSLPPGTRPWYGMWLDSNPPDTDHWLYRIFEEERPEGFDLFRQPDGLSPEAENTENLPEGYYQTICAGKDQDWINVYVRGQYGFVKEGKAVFPEWNDRMHVAEVEASSKFGPILLGMDFGLTPACVIAQRDPSDSQLQVLEEFWSDDMGAVTFGESLRRHLSATYGAREVRGWGDPAGDIRGQTDERTVYDVLSSVGLASVRKAPTNDLVRRLEAVKHGLTRLTVKGRPSLVVSPRCTRLRKAMGGGYCYRRVQVSGDERYKDEPDKLNPYSHIADALQYLACGSGDDRKAIRVADPAEFRLNLRVKRSIGRR